MGSNEIGLIAAMPDETASLLKLFPPILSRRLEAYQYHQLSCADRTIHLVQSGMGPANARAAAGALLTQAQPDLLLSIGFAGAIRPGAKVGDLIVARQMLSFDKGKLSPSTGLTASAVERLATLLGRESSAREWHCLCGTYITTAQFVAKSEMARLLPTEVEHPVLEMESAAVAGVASAVGIPFAALRTVSDAAGEELGFTIEEIADDTMNVVPLKAILLIMRRPWLIPQFYRLARNARLAGRNLAEAVALCLESMNA